MLQDYQDYTCRPDDCLEANHYDIYYRDWDGSRQFARFVAADQQHACDQFAIYFPRVEIIEVVDRGSAF